MSESDKEALNKQLKTCDTANFFPILEQCVEFRIPKQLQVILTLNLMNNAVSFSRDISGAISEIENFVRYDFKKSMLKVNQSIEDVLGVWAKNQKSFKFMSGQKRMMIAIADYCQQLYPINVMAKKKQKNDCDKENDLEEIESSSSNSPKRTEQENTTGNVESKCAPPNKRSVPIHTDEIVTSQSVPVGSVLRKPEQHHIEQRPTNESLDRDKVIKGMFDQLHSWITRQNIVQGTAEEPLVFKMSQDYYTEHQNGSISYRIVCPFGSCNKHYIVTYTSYPSYYVHKKGPKRNLLSSNYKPPKWNFKQIQLHFLKKHSSSTQDVNLLESFENDDDDDAKQSLLSDDDNVIEQLGARHEHTNEKATDLQPEIRENEETINRRTGRYPIRNKKLK